MHFSKIFVIVCTVYSALFVTVDLNILDTEGNFFGLTQEVTISDATLDLVEQLEKEVFAHAEGDRRVRRYFDTYDTPFIGQGRRNYDSNYD